MEDIRSWWEVPCVSHFCKIFSKPFKLPEYEIEELEDALLLDMNPDPSSLLVQLFVVFLNGIVDRDITEDNWQSFLKLHVRWRCDFLNEKWDPFQSKQCDYAGLNSRDKIELLHKLCHWRMELDDVGDLVRGYDGPSLRLAPLGRDGDGGVYWFFFGTRLYREASNKKVRRVKKKKDDAPESGRGRGRGGVSSSARKRGAGKKQVASTSTPRRKNAAATRPAKPRRTPSSRVRGRRALANRDDSSDNESQSEGQSTSRGGRGQRGRGSMRGEQPYAVDDEGYEGSGEDGGGVRRRRARQREQLQPPPPTLVEETEDTTAEKEEEKEEEKKEIPDKDGEEKDETLPVAADTIAMATDATDTIAMATDATDTVATATTSTATAAMETSPARQEEGESMEVVVEKSSVEGERETEGDHKDEEIMEGVADNMAGNTNSNNNKRVSGDEGEEGGCEGGEDGTSRRRSLRARNRTRVQKAPVADKEESPAAVADGDSGEHPDEEENSKEEEEEEEDDANDWKPSSSSSRGRGKRRAQGRKVELSEQESEEEEEEDIAEEEKEKGTEDKKEQKWKIVCGSEEEWVELVDSLSKIRTPTVKKLYRALEELLPNVQYLFREREKEMKKKMIAELPRRTSDRIALKAQREEEERLDAQLRERQREALRQERDEEQQRREDEAEEKRQKRREEAIMRRKAREEEQTKVREEEERNWQQAMSGELSGPRRAALGAAEGVSEVIKGVEGEGTMDDLAMEGDKEEFLYTAFYKVLGGLRRQEDSWVFEDPVTEAIAPGYHDLISMPMDYVTVESRLEKKHYSTRVEFETDVKLIFNNCKEYNGDGSEYSDLANQMLQELDKLCKVHLDGGGVKLEPETKAKGVRESRSPSVCKTPELTSESSSEEASDGESDESYSEGGPTKMKKKLSANVGGGGSKPLFLTPKLSQLPNSAHQQHPPRHPHPYYHQMMMQQYRMRFEAPPPHGVPPEMMFRGAPYGRLPPPPPYSSHPHLQRPPPEHMFPPYHHPQYHHPHYPPPSPFTPSHHHRLPPYIRPGFHPQMMPTTPPHHHRQPQQHLSPSGSPGMHSRPGSVPPGPNSVPRGSSGTPPVQSDPGSIPPAAEKSVESTEKERDLSADEEKKMKGKDDEEGEREGGERREGDKETIEKEKVTVSEEKRNTAENGSSPSKAVHSGPPPPPPSVPHQMSKQQQAAYRYHQQMMMMRSQGGVANHAPPDPYHQLPPGYDPHFSPRHQYPPRHRPPTSHPSQDGYPGWHHHPQAMYGGRDGRHDYPSEEARQHQQQQMYWMEMERRRQYYMYTMQQRAAKAAQMGRSQKAVAPGNNKPDQQVGAEKPSDREGEKAGTNKNADTEEKTGGEENTNKDAAVGSNKNGDAEEVGTKNISGVAGINKNQDTPEKVGTNKDEYDTNSTGDKERVKVAEGEGKGDKMAIAAGNKPEREKNVCDLEDKPSDTVTKGNDTPPAVAAAASKEEGEKKMAASGGKGEREGEKMVAEVRDPAKEVQKQRHPHHPHNGHPGHQDHEIYSYPPHMYPSPHMYAMPPGYGMRPHPQTHWPCPPNHPHNNAGLPPYQQNPGPENNAVANSNNIDNKQVVATQRGWERGYPHGYWQPREGFPPGYPPRADVATEMAIPQPNDPAGFPPGYAPWAHHHHGYPPTPMDPAMMVPLSSSDQRERWKMEQYRHANAHPYMQYQYRAPQPPPGQRSPHHTPTSHSSPQKRPAETPPTDDNAPPSKKVKASA